MKRREERGESSRVPGRILKEIKWFQGNERSSRCHEDEEGKNEPISRLFARKILYCRRWNWKAWENIEPLLKRYRSSVKLSNRVKINDNYVAPRKFPPTFGRHFAMERERTPLLSSCRYYSYIIYIDIIPILFLSSRIDLWIEIVNFYPSFLESLWLLQS